MTNIEILKLQLRWSSIKRLIVWQMDKPAYVCKFCGDHVEKNTLCPKCGMGQEIEIPKHDLIALLKYIDYLEKYPVVIKEFLEFMTKGNKHNISSIDELKLWENGEGESFEPIVSRLEELLNA